uniref:Uncharacterized protein n=1 Tax=Arundo donax TaxID=35708 RepID=A0A0A9A0W2_ARUDO
MRAMEAAVAGAARSGIQVSCRRRREHSSSHQ